MKNGRLCTIVVLKSPELHNISGETNDRFGSLRENFLAGIGFIILTKRVADAELWLNPGWRCTH
jgi:hypothetical protein